MHFAKELTGTPEGVALVQIILLSISLHDYPPNLGIKRPFEPVYSISSLSGVCHGCDPFQLETERVRIRFVPGGRSDTHG